MTGAPWPVPEADDRGVIRIAGSPALRPVAEWLAGTEAVVDLNGADDGLNAMTAGVAQLALLDRSAWEQERRPFRVTFGREALAIRIGYFGLESEAPTCPPAVFVHRSNPLGALDTGQIARIFTRGAGEGDIVHWSQLGVAGPWSARRIHLYGTRDAGGWATNSRISRFEGRQFAQHYEPLPDDSDVMGAVAEDRFAIAFVEAAARRDIAGVRMVPLIAAGRRAGALPTPEAVQRGDYPYPPEMLLYINPADRDHRPVISRIVAEALSASRQAELASVRGIAGGVMPLSRRDAEDARMKLAAP